MLAVQAFILGAFFVIILGVLISVIWVEPPWK